MSESPPPSFWKLLRSTFSGEGYDYAKGSLRIAVPLLAVPMVLEMAMEALFAICDVFFLAMVGPTAVATVGFAESLLALIYALAFGIAMPATALVARRIGEGDSKAASRAGAQAIWFGLAVGLATGLSALAAPQLLVLMGAETAVVRQGTVFTIIALASSPTVVLLFVNSAVLR
ncbi:MAG: MATE family efflux transporter, partial [Myxococcota bacterium]